MFLCKSFFYVFGPDSLSVVDEAYDDFTWAVAAYERSSEVTQFSSKFDLSRESFTQAEERGLLLFENNCSSCHSTSPSHGSDKGLFTNFKYYNAGIPLKPIVALDSPDLGLGAVVNDNLQDGKFKVPTLRNIARTPPYSHNGFFAELRDMISFMNDNSGYTPEIDRNINDKVGCMNLSEEDIDDIMMFLMTLSDS